MFSLISTLFFQCNVEAQEKSSGKDTLVYVSAHTGPKSKGIYLFRLQTSNLEVAQNITLVPLGLAVETPNPVYFELDLKRRLLFALNDVPDFEGKPGGAVSAFSIDPAGKLTLLNQRSSKGMKPCHLALDKDARNLLVSNCDGGNIVVLPIASDGKLGEATDTVQFSGKPLPRGVVFDPSGQFAYVCDVGADKIFIYRFDAQKGKLTPANPAFIAVKADSGPRHLAFRPDGKFAYGINELNSTVNAFSFDPATGALKEIQSVASVPEYFDGTNKTVEVAVHPTGKWLYVSNNGQNGVVLYDIDPAKGTLTYVEEQGTGGTNPIHFGIQPSAQHLAIANHDTDQVLASRIDAGNGRLKPSGIFATVSSPTCVRFLPPAAN